MKYSIVLSTTGVRSTLRECLENFAYFTRARPDVELIIGTNSPTFLSPKDKVVYAPNHRVCWSDAIDVSKGEFIANVGDDLKLSKNYFTVADELFQDPAVAMIQPTLLDAEGFVCLKKHYETYTVSIFRRRLLDLIGMDYDGRGTRWWRNDIDFIEAAWERASVQMGDGMYAVHYGYPIKGGVDSLMSPYGDKIGFIEKWREENNHERIDLEKILP